ncbi:hypothetical protein SEA_PEPE_81 [Mycobacterium phage Pepe]|uniref:NifU-like Fe-S cluster assembly protein n=1 Tax=Mycobacterium phage Pepe TaxID=1735466 RepID=UPI0007062EA3|nr:NifU-like Fe-S cluster assembly protein [Mycobacterium phage Pepe]ALK87055.1 hypothetical protein SEA_PEPE_81 [Mycobacterium phage Pepe]
MSSLYQEVILDHFKNPRNHGLAEVFDAEGFAVSSVCGDEARVRLTVTAGGVRMTHEVTGCAISQAAASALSEALEGVPADDVPAVLSQFSGAVRGQETTLDGDVAAFSGVSAFPARVHCALLPVTALYAALARLN